MAAMNRVPPGSDPRTVCRNRYFALRLHTLARFLGALLLLAACGRDRENPMDSTSLPQPGTSGESASADREDPVSPADLAAIEFRKGDMPAALAAVNMALVGGDDPELFNLRGAIYQQMGEHSTALADFERVPAEHPAYATALGNRSLSEYALGDAAAAEASLHKALEIDPSSALSHYNLGVVLAEQGRSTEALPLLQQAVALEPGDSDYWFQLGIVADQVGDLQVGIDAFSAAITLDNGFDDRSFAMRGMLYAESEQYDLALDDLDTALERGASDDLTLFYRALVLFRRGEWQQAIAGFEQTLRVNPYMADAHFYLSYAFAELGDQENARAHAQTALDLDPPIETDGAQ